MQFKTLDEFRAAIRAGDFGAADWLLEELRLEVTQSWAKAEASERQSMAAQVLDVLTWARQTALANRSHIQRRLAEVRRDDAYAPANPRVRRQLQLEV